MSASAFSRRLAAGRRRVATIRRHVRATWDYLLLLIHRIREDRCLQVAGSLTFTTLLALVPLITIGVTVFSTFPLFAGFSGAIRQFVVTNLMPASAGRVITVYMQQFADNAGRLTTWGIAILGVSAVLTMLTIDRAFNTIWRVRRPRTLLNRLLIYWAVLTVGPLLIGASLSVTSWLLTLSMGIVRGAEEAELVLLRVVPLILTCAAMAFLYRMVPSRRVDTRDAVAGGALAGLAFEGMKAAFGAYVRAVPTYKLVYGAFASFPIFLLWIYLSWLVLVLGAEFTAALPYLRTGGVRLKRRPGEQFLEAARLLRHLYQAHRGGRVTRTEELRVGLRLPFEECEQLLDRLAAAGWVAPTTGDGWVLARDAAEIRLADVYREFVFRSDLAEGAEPSFESLVAQLTRDAHETLSMNLETLFTLKATERRRHAA
ncbi:MAG TPA: YihY family inner membrane protein [Burkholderiales bacterium]|nr:YihY family inner membrane protein [Burkholderiales bacterium]